MVFHGGIQFDPQIQSVSGAVFASASGPNVILFGKRAASAYFANCFRYSGWYHQPVLVFCIDSRAGVRVQRSGSGETKNFIAAFLFFVGGGEGGVRSTETHGLPASRHSGGASNNGIYHRFDVVVRLVFHVYSKRRSRPMVGYVCVQGFRHIQRAVRKQGLVSVVRPETLLPFARRRRVGRSVSVRVRILTRFSFWR